MRRCRRDHLRGQADPLYRAGGNMMVQRTPRSARDGVTFTLTVCEDDTPVRGNALASGDETEDRACEDEILARLATGDVWAWATVTVTATWREWSGSDHLGGCSYADEADFKAPGGYFDDMKREAYDRLMERIGAAAHEAMVTP